MDDVMASLRVALDIALGNGLYGLVVTRAVCDRTGVGMGVGLQRFERGGLLSRVTEWEPRSKIRWQCTGLSVPRTC